MRIQDFQDGDEIEVELGEYPNAVIHKSGSLLVANPHPLVTENHSAAPTEGVTGDDFGHVIAYIDGNWSMDNVSFV